jgi:hypothetical protein
LTLNTGLPSDRVAHPARGNNQALEATVEEMKGTANPSWSQISKPLALVLALLSFLFLLQVTPHGHANGQDEAACRLCQVAHLGVAAAVTAVCLNIPLVPVGQVTPSAPLAKAEIFFAHSSSRAPPSLDL